MFVECRLVGETAQLIEEGKLNSWPLRVIAVNLLMTSKSRFRIRQNQTESGQSESDITRPKTPNI